MQKTFYITIEGCDGCGKTTTVKGLLTYLQELTKKVLLTKEFGSEHNLFCSSARKIALSSEYSTDEIAGQLMFAAIARQHQQKVIKPAKESGEIDIILSDRGMDTNFAYGPVHQIPQKTINQIFSIAYSDSIVPDVTIFLDSPPALSRKRRAARAPEQFNNGGIDRVESKGPAFQEKVRAKFLALAKKHSDRIKVIKINEKMSPQDVLNEVITILKDVKVLE